MKKISLILVTITLLVVFTACSGAKKNEAPVEEQVKSENVEAVVEAEPQPEAPALNPAEVLKSFQEYAKAYGEAFNNITKEYKKYSELAGQSQKRIAEMESIKDQLNKKQSDDYQKALDIVLKVNRGGQ